VPDPKEEERLTWHTVEQGREKWAHMSLTFVMEMLMKETLAPGVEKNMTQRSCWLSDYRVWGSTESPGCQGDRSGFASLLTH
jgi:hypothetical protein